MILTSESPTAGALQALLALSPGLLQVLGEALLLYRKPLAVTPSATAPSGDVKYVYMVLHRTA
jgi:nicotinamide mononucleotide (NMN) deamidase PncC